jgi:hypothetical protein
MALSTEAQAAVDRIQAIRGDGVDKANNPEVDELILLAEIAEKLDAV